MFPSTATEVVLSPSLFNRTSVPLGKPLTNIYAMDLRLSVPYSVRWSVFFNTNIKPTFGIIFNATALICYRGILMTGTRGKVL